MKLAHLTFPSPHYELVVHLLSELEINCFEQRDHPQTNSIELIFSAEQWDLKELIKNNFSGVPKIEFSISELPDANWESAWKEHWQPQLIGERFIVIPSWLEAGVPLDRTPIYLDTTNAFGTGSHPSTRLAFGLLEQLSTERLLTSMLDYGCGSGLLAIGGAKMGITRIVGIDIAEQAIATSVQNALRNESSNISFINISYATHSLEKYDVVVANMITSELSACWSSITAAISNEGALILAGLLEDEVEEFCAYHNLKPSKVAIEMGWAGILFFA